MISIAICTYNRAEQLRITLNSLAESGEWLQRNAELLVINNNSTDDTGDVIEEFKGRLKIKYLSEAKQGLANARNCALRNFSGDALIFFDDDVTVTQEALERYRRALDCSKYDFFGGSIEVDWSGKAPSWFGVEELPLINGMVGEYHIAETDKEYSESMLLPYGANFMITRKLIDELGLFDARLGVSGDEIGRGEETDYFQRALSAGRRGKYLSKAVVFHRFQRERLTVRYMFKYGLAKGRGSKPKKGLTLDEKLTLIRRISYNVFSGLFQLVKGKVGRFYQCVINIGILSATLRR